MNNIFAYFFIQKVLILIYRNVNGKEFNGIWSKIKQEVILSDGYDKESINSNRDQTLRYNPSACFVSNLGQNLVWLSLNCKYHSLKIK